MLQSLSFRLLAVLALAWPALAAAQPIVYLDKCAAGHFMGLDLAIDYCERAIKSGGLSHRDTGTAHFYRARWYLQQGRLQPALADLDEVTRLDALGDTSSDLRASNFVSRGFVHIRMGNMDAALADFDEAIRLNPRVASSYRGRGHVWLARREPDRALADFSQALKSAVSDKTLSTAGAGSTYGRRPRYFDRTDNDAAAYLGRGQAYLLKNDPEAAMAQFNEALRVNPKSNPALKSRAALHEQRGDFDSAIGDYSAAVHDIPADASAYFARGRAWVAKGEFANGALDLDATVKLDPSAPAYVLLWKYVADVRAAGTDSAKRDAVRQELARESLRVADGSLYAQLVEFYLGRAEESAVRQAGRNLVQSCQAHFFVAQHHLMGANRPRGAQVLAAVAKQCPPQLQETWAARLELARLSRSAN